MRLIPMPVVACALVASVQASAVAQQWHSIDRADVRYYAELLELDEQQIEAAVELHREYRAEMRRIGEAMQDRLRENAAETLEDVREGRLESAYFSAFMRATTRAEDEPDWATQMFDTERALLDGVLGLATTPEQREGAERVERAWRRNRVSSAPSPWGNSADVVAMVRDSRLAGVDGIEGILLEYEVEIDPVRRMSIEPWPIEAAPEAQPADERQTWQATALRAKRINTQYAVRVKKALPAEHHDAWDRAVREAFWPEPYERSGPQKVFMTLLRVKSLSDEERVELEDIQTRYESRAKAINRTWALAIDAHLHADADQDWESAGDANETIYECREDRRQLDREFEGILSEFQRNR